MEDKNENLQFQLMPKQKEAITYHQACIDLWGWGLKYFDLIFLLSFLVQKWYYSFSFSDDNQKVVYVAQFMSSQTLHSKSYVSLTLVRTEIYIYIYHSIRHEIGFMDAYDTWFLNGKFVQIC